MLFFFSAHVAFAFEAFVHLYAAAKKNNVQSNKKSVNLGTLPVFDVGTKHLVKLLPIYLSGTCEGCLKKNEKLYGKMLNLTEQVKEFYMEK